MSRIASQTAGRRLPQAALAGSLLLLGLAGVGHAAPVVVVPWAPGGPAAWQAPIVARPAPRPERLPWEVRGLLVAWAAGMGACVGSFVNVVVYRLPAGRSLLRPPSQCPACGKPVAWYDNVPVLAWCWLRGRCRSCRQPFSARYPLVEAALGAATGGLAALAFLYPASNLPWAAAEGLSDLGLGAVALAHAALVATLLAAAEIEADGGRLPPRLFLPALAVALIVTSVFPAARPSAFPWRPLRPDMLGRLDDTLFTLLAGVILSLALRAGESPEADGTGRSARFWAVVTLAATVGTVAALVLTTGVVLVRLLERILWPRRGLPFFGNLMLVAVAGLLGWRVWWSWWPLADPRQGPRVFALLLPLIGVCWLLHRWDRSSPPTTASSAAGTP